MSEKRGDILSDCKAGMVEYCKHVAEVLFQLNEYKQTNLNSILFNKACLDMLQKWHFPGDSKNFKPIKFSRLTFVRSDL